MIPKDAFLFSEELLKDDTYFDSIYTIVNLFWKNKNSSKAHCKRVDKVYYRMGRYNTKLHRYYFNSRGDWKSEHLVSMKKQKKI